MSGCRQASHPVTIRLVGVEPEDSGVPCVGGNRSPGLMKNHSVQRNRQGIDTDSPRPAVMLQESSGTQAMGPTLHYNIKD